MAVDGIMAMGSCGTCNLAGSKALQRSPDVGTEIAGPAGSTPEQSSPKTGAIKRVRANNCDHMRNNPTTDFA